MADAIGLTLWRLAVTRRRLLEWVPAGEAKRRLDLTIGGFYRRMLPAVLLGAACGAFVSALRPRALPEALVFVAAWLLSPLAARAISLPPRLSEERELSEAETRFLSAIGRRTWRYFETFAGAEEHFLPVDNFQEIPQPVVAHRTSPTNIGLALLSTVAANDLGWIDRGEMTARLEATFETLERLERFRGHFYNWYDTRDLRPLEPKYISTVDSGNLAGHLIALRQACLESIANPAPVAARALEGIADALSLVKESAARLIESRREGPLTRRQFEDSFAAIESLLASVPD